ncbi:MAG: HPF/RaiA family ribosome-associated protein [Gemmatimonadetes bacterium]|nr:HPF/RaiA family ribosome-associated protein [Gemmatimonadota bacterium]
MIPTRITAQGCEVDDELRLRAQAISERWPRFDTDMMEASVVFRLEGREHSVEAIVSRRRRQALVAAGSGGDFRAALDDLDAHVRRRLRRDRSRRRDHRHESPGPSY